VNDYGVFHKRRGIHQDDVCPRCAGIGVRAYGNTSTWRRGIGGAAITKDACDECWGSGDFRHPWPSHREFWEMKRALAEQEASS